MASNTFNERAAMLYDHLPRRHDHSGGIYDRLTVSYERQRAGYEPLHVFHDHLHVNKESNTKPNGFETRGGNVKKHSIWGRNSHSNWCPYFCWYINV